MQAFFVDFVTLLETRHREILKAIEGLPPEALDWNPGPEMNSLSVLVIHLAGAERYWIGDVVAQDPTYRDRDAEFKVHDLGADVLKKKLADNAEYIRKVLSDFGLEDLQALRSTKGGETVTVAWGLLHALEHTTLHLGQIELTRQLWEQSRSHS